jgi:hypothetical protein
MSTLRVFSRVAAFALCLAPATALAQPGQATLITPRADVVGTTVAFTWQSVPTATWYLFWLGHADTTPIMEQWYTAQQAGCNAGGTCTITLTPPIGGGAFVWYIRTWAGLNGPWSLGHLFTVKEPENTWSAKLPTSRRFRLVLDGAGVLDNETGLVWQRAVNGGNGDWAGAVTACPSVATGGRYGWRLPTLPELQSLVDPTQSAPALPVGHPFVMPNAPLEFWSYSLGLGNTNAYGVDFTSGGFIFAGIQSSYKHWCVRGSPPAP